MTKSEARKLARAVRKETDRDTLLKISKSICDKIIKDEDFINSEYVLLYAPCNNEIDTEELLEYCMNHGKKAAFPKITDTAASDMEFVCINDKEQLKKGYMDIPEPEGNDYLDIFNNNNVYMILPGLAFDKTGTRAGYGKGFYDRYISRGFTGKKVAVAMEKVVFDCITADSYDIMWDILVTEENIYINKR